MIKNFLPRSLLGRSLLIIFTPMVFILLVSAYIFFEFHWAKVSLRMARSLAGDVASIDPDGFLSIQDRAKDLIKSGGEWISSIDLENLAMAHPAIAQAAAIGVKHPRWDERPILVAVCAEGAEKPSIEEIREHLSSEFAKWQLPDDIVWVDAIPLTATGKFSKLNLRKQLVDYVHPELRETA